jgi:hypothetical protein
VLLPNRDALPRQVVDTFLDKLQPRHVLMDHHLSTTGASSWTNMENKNRRLLWDQTVFSMQANAAVTRVFKGLMEMFASSTADGAALIQGGKSYTDGQMKDWALEGGGKVETVSATCTQSLLRHPSAHPPPDCSSRPLCTCGPVTIGPFKRGLPGSHE